MTALRIGLFVLLQFSAAGQSRITISEARKLVDAVLPANAKKLRHLVIELDRERGGCMVYHAYQSPESPGMTLTLGYWSIDTRTAEVWSDLIFERIANQRLAPIQLAIRKRLGVTDKEHSASISNPCYERDSR